jgi:hypothetical protein
MNRNIVIFFLGVIGVLCSITESRATSDQLKLYRKVYPDLKPNCQYCHIDKIPKKEAGQHELDPYGLKLKELMGETALTEDIIKSAGRHDEFKEQKEEK